MSDQGRNNKEKEGSTFKDVDVLGRLLDLLNTPASKQQLPALGSMGASSRVGKGRRDARFQSTEALQLEAFSSKYKNERAFSSLHEHSRFLEILTALITQRLLCRQWRDRAPMANILPVLICLRLFMRDFSYQRVLYDMGGVSGLAMYMDEVAQRHLCYEEEKFAEDVLVNLTNIFQKLAGVVEQREWVTESGAHKTLVILTAARESSVLLGSLLALNSLAESAACRGKLAELAVVENLLPVLQDYDLLSQRLAMDLLRQLCQERPVWHQMRVLGGVPVLLSLLQGEHLRLLASAVWALVHLCEDQAMLEDIRRWGGVTQLLRLLQGDRERRFVSDRISFGGLSSANAAGRLRQLPLSEELSPAEIQDGLTSLQAACCTALTELVLNDSNAQQVVQANGVYIIGTLLLPNPTRSTHNRDVLQRYAFRALRFLFSMERNRHLFKRLFPAVLFEMFIDVGHYVRDIVAYEPLVLRLNALKPEEVQEIQEAVESMDQTRLPEKRMGGYAVLEHLGSGAFGSVYKVRKLNGQQLLALKEVSLHNPAFGKDKTTRDSSLNSIISELSIIREQLKHPNIVKYYKTFVEDDRLYIVMELIEGAPLGEHFNALKEKHERFTEERIWNIFIQICLALRYLHKEKHIIHRDLTPGNIMLGESDHITITDFGLAKQKQENSKLTSMVGTIVYSCPEILKNEPYDERADVWAAGCILYQLAMLTPPFYSTNMLSLASRIVGATYEPITEGLYSAQLSKTVRRCLSPEAGLRPDVVEVCAGLSARLMAHADALGANCCDMEHRLERERRRTQRRLAQAHMHAHCCLAQQEQEGKGGSLESSGGASSLRSEEGWEGGGTLGVDWMEGGGKPGSALVEEGLVGLPCAFTLVPKTCIDHAKRGAESPIYGLEGEDSLLTPPGPSSTVSSPSRQHPSAERRRYSRSADSICRGSSRPRPRSGTGIAVSQRKVRQISDPIQQILLQLHKLIYISQLPPSLTHNRSRRAVERFKKSLFSPHSNACNLKSEIQKVVQGSQEVIDLGWALAKPGVYCQSSSSSQLSSGETHRYYDGDDNQEGITYGQMQCMIEDVLMESGYYSTGQATRHQDLESSTVRALLS
ncbi:serine/threonine-protein kinase Nek10 [Lethenteron reissneri]|uniref:serine/threonine-protein kinase Nek10 n=1 Tax=Lethenteron reissneri TaxID=7753 RepID=UPI002AB69E46|nr:serine/threonine-protein kinase Nek10 [Lethenteron reissneri]